MTHAVSIEWERCPDGVVGMRGKPNDAERIDLARLMEPDFDSPSLTAIYEGLSPPQPPEPEIWLQYATERREKVSRRLDGLKDTLLLEYVNADGLRGLLDFVAAYGFPAPGSSMHPFDLVDLHHGMREILTLHEEKAFTQAAGHFRKMASLHIADLRPDLTMQGGGPEMTFTLVPDSLQGFMLLEAASLLAGGTLMMRCAQCDALFVSGAHTGRRKTAHYCSNRCRVAAQRARAAQRP